MRKGFLERASRDDLGPLRDERSKRMTWSEFAGRKRLGGPDRVGRLPGNSDSTASASLVEPISSTWPSVDMSPDLVPPEPEVLFSSGRKRAAPTNLDGVADNMEAKMKLNDHLESITIHTTSTHIISETSDLTSSQPPQQQQQPIPPPPPPSSSYKVAPPVKQRQVPKAALYTWCNRPPLRICLGDSNYITWDNGARPHEKRYTSVFIDPRNGETFASGPWGEDKSYILDRGLYWYTTKRLAEHAAAAVAYDCFTFRVEQQNGNSITYERMCERAPYMPHEATQIPEAVVPPESWQKLVKAIGNAGGTATFPSTDAGIPPPIQNLWSNSVPPNGPEPSWQNFSGGDEPTNFQVPRNVHLQQQPPPSQEFGHQHRYFQEPTPYQPPYEYPSAPQPNLGKEAEIHAWRSQRK